MNVLYYRGTSIGFVISLVIQVIIPRPLWFETIFMFGCMLCCGSIEKFFFTRKTKRNFTR